MQKRAHEFEKIGAQAEALPVEVKEAKDSADAVDDESEANAQMRKQLAYAHESCAQAAAEVLRLRNDLSASQTKSNPAKIDEVSARWKEVQAALHKSLNELIVYQEGDQKLVLQPVSAYASEADQKLVGKAMTTGSDLHVSAYASEADQKLVGKAMTTGSSLQSESERPSKRVTRRCKTVSFAGEEIQATADDLRVTFATEGKIEVKAEKKLSDAGMELRRECDSLRTKLALAQKLRDQALGDAGELRHECELLRSQIGGAEARAEARNEDLQRALNLADKAAQEWKQRATMSFWSRLTCNTCTSGRQPSDMPVSLQ